MNFKKENGVTNMDFVLGLIIFIIGAVSILNLYVHIYKTTSKVKVDETIIGYITEICEQIDLKDYDEITKDNVNKIIVDAKIPSNYKVECFDIEKYSDDYKEKSGKTIPDVVKKVYLNVSYKFDNIDRNYEFSKTKVKE